MTTMQTPPVSDDVSTPRTTPTNSTGVVQRYHVEHALRFGYSAPVSLDQMVLRLQPRTGVHQRLVSFAINSDPRPTKQTHCIDLHGNIRHWFWYERCHNHLHITTRAVVDCYNGNPFDFIVVDPGVERMPVLYAEPVRSATKHYRYRPNPSLQVDAFANQIVEQSGGNTVHFLTDLNSAIHERVEHILRPTGEPWEPADTLARGRGSCRDSAVLFMDACRAVGLAARFVSGYAWDAEDPNRRELHAWAEVYLPGGGWIGYDPTIGLAVADRHIPIAASPTPSYAAPTTGTFTGPPVDASLDWHIDITKTELPLLTGPPQTTYHWA